MRLLVGKMNSFLQIVLHDAPFQVRAQGAVADYFACEIQCAILQLRTGINQNVETFERNQSAGAKKSDWADRMSLCLGYGKTGEVNSVINAKDFLARFRATRCQHIATVIRLSAHKFGAGAKFAQQFVVAEIAHEILPMSRDTEGDPADCLDKHGGVRGAVREMNMKMRHCFAPEELDKKKRVPRP